ncbi:hypothetical protein X975_03585, partial [Stegodyphus mimosarum]
MTVGLSKLNSTNAEYLAELIKERNIENSFYIEGLIGILICSLVVLAIIAVILYYIIPWHK